MVLRLIALMLPENMLKIKVIVHQCRSTVLEAVMRSGNLWFINSSGDSDVHPNVRTTVVEANES